MLWVGDDECLKHENEKIIWYLLILPFILIFVLNLNELNLNRGKSNSTYFDLIKIIGILILPSPPKKKKRKKNISNHYFVPNFFFINPHSSNRTNHLTTGNPLAFNNLFYQILSITGAMHHSFSTLFI